MAMITANVSRARKLEPTSFQQVLDPPEYQVHARSSVCRAFRMLHSSKNFHSSFPSRILKLDLPFLEQGLL
uniref:Uncharacterized protein n=1 Tax=Hyaloperonospora arabidopsidis (strain Emoy2) TaxID=559515 RepID=M4BZ68_HYAAE